MADRYGEDSNFLLQYARASKKWKEDPKWLDRIIDERVNVFVGELENRAKANSGNVNRTLSRSAPRIGSRVPTMDRVFGVLSPAQTIDPLYRANAAMQGKETTPQALTAFTSTFVKTLSKNVLADLERSITGKETRTQYRVTGQDYARDMLQLRGGAATGAGMGLDIITDPSVWINAVKPVYGVLTNVTKKSIDIARKAPKIDAGLDALGKRFDLFYEVKKTMSSKRFADFENTFRMVTTEGDFSKFMQFGKKVTSSSQAQRMTNLGWGTALADKGLNTTFFPPSVNRVLETAFGKQKPLTGVAKGMHVTTNFAKQLLPWNWAWHAGNAIDETVNSVMHGAGPKDFYNAAKMHFTGGRGNPALYGELSKRGVFSSTGQTEAAISEGTGLWTKIKNIPGIIGNTIESITRAANVLHDIPKMGIEKAVTRTTRIHGQYNAAYLTDFEKMMREVIPYYQFQKAQVIRQPWMVTQNANKYAAMYHVKDSTTPDSLKKDPSLTPDHLDQMRIGSFSGFRLGFDDFTKNIKALADLDWRKLSSHLNPLTQFGTRAATGIDTRTGLPLGSERKKQYDNADPFTKWFVGYDEKTKKVNNPLREWLVGDYLGVVTRQNMIANDPNRPMWNSMVPFHGYKTDRDTLLWQKSMRDQQAVQAARVNPAEHGAIGLVLSKLNELGGWNLGKSKGTAAASTTPVRIEAINPDVLVAEARIREQEARNVMPKRGSKPLVTDIEQSMGQLDARSEAANIPTDIPAENRKWMLNNSRLFYSGDSTLRQLDAQKKDIMASEYVALDAGARAAPVGQQWIQKLLARQAYEVGLAWARGADPEVIKGINAGFNAQINRRPMTAEEVSKAVVVQGDQGEMSYLKDMKTQQKNLHSLISQLNSEGQFRGPKGIAYEIRSRWERKLEENESSGYYASPKERAKGEAAVQRATEVQTQLWFDEIERATLKIARKAVDAIIDPRQKIVTEAEFDKSEYVASKEMRELERAAKAPNAPETLKKLYDDKLNRNSGFIDAAAMRKLQEYDLKELDTRANQLEAFYAQQTEALTAQLQLAFESGAMGLKRFFEGQRKQIESAASGAIGAQLEILDRATSAIDEAKSRTMVEEATLKAAEGDLEGLQQYRDKLTEAGVDVEAFFKAAAELARIVVKHSGDIATLTGKETSAKRQYEQASLQIAASIASIRQQTAQTNTQVTGIPEPLKDTIGTFTKQWDDETKRMALDAEKSLGIDSTKPPVAGQGPGDPTPEDVQAYYDKLAQIKDLEAERDKQRDANIALMKKQHWDNQVSVAKTGTAMLSDLATQLYEYSGKQSKSMFQLLKAARLAEALVNGYSATVAAYNAGASVGGPYAVAVGAAYAAMAMAATGVQIAMIRAQEMAEGGKIVGGSGRKDDVPLMAMGGEYVVRKKAVEKYGERFMDALNEGMLDVKDFAIPAVPARQQRGPWYADGGIVKNNPMETTIVLENKTGQNMKMKDGGMKFDGKKYVRSVIFELADTDPSFASMMRGGGRG